MIEHRFLQRRFTFDNSFFFFARYQSFCSANDRTILIHCDAHASLYYPSHSTTAASLALESVQLVEVHGTELGSRIAATVIAGDLVDDDGTFRAPAQG